MSAASGAGYQARTVARICGAIILALTIAYLLLVVLPYFGNGIHLRSFEEIAGSHVDVKGYPPFVWFTPVQGAALLASALTPLTAALAPVVLVSLAMCRRSLRHAEAALWLVAAVLNITTLAATWQTLGLIRTWLVD
jgi:hypothetical protein